MFSDRVQHDGVLEASGVAQGSMACDENQIYVRGVVLEQGLKPGFLDKGPHWLTGGDEFVVAGEVEQDSKGEDGVVVYWGGEFTISFP
jgi:hypothetical protein